MRGHVMAMGMECKEDCTAFHRELLPDNITPTASGDLWSKNSTALFGLVSHGIRRTSAPQEDGSVVVKWKMVENSRSLCRAVIAGTQVSTLASSAMLRGLRLVL